MSLAMYRHTLSCTTKPVHASGVQTAEEVRRIARMASVVGPPEEMLTLGISPVSPLFFPDDVVGAILETARLGIPLGPYPAPSPEQRRAIAGRRIGPAECGGAGLPCAGPTGAPGLPVFYCGRLAMMEPRSGISVWGGVELGIASAATVQVGHRYGLPVNVYGFSTNAHTLDIQSGYERALNAAIPALAGADELSGIGEMAAGVMGSYAQMVCDNEIARSVRRLLRGFAVDEDALAVEVIAAVMDGSRNFLGQRHTVRYLRAGEILMSRLAERRPWEEWERTGREGLAERAQAEAERILAEHGVPPLDPGQERELGALMDDGR